MIQQDFQIVRKTEDKNLDDNCLIIFSDLLQQDIHKYSQIELFVPATKSEFVSLNLKLSHLISNILKHKYPENYIDVERDFLLLDNTTIKLKGPNYVYYSLEKEMSNHLKHFFDRWHPEKFIIHRSTTYRERQYYTESTINTRFNYNNINIKQLYIDLYNRYIDEISKIEKFDDLII
jgi:hypothetical protein